jgi:opacity protein-like surface antigen
MWHMNRFVQVGALVVGVLITLAYPAIGSYEKSKSASASVAKTNEGTAREEKSEIYLGLFMMGNNPSNRSLKFEDDPYTNTNVGGGLGGGFKIGVFPAFTGRIVGLEAELAGFTGNVDAPQATSGGVTRSAHFRLNLINAMTNLLFRYPGKIVQPYLGMGVGISGGFARSLNVQNSSVGTITENAGDGAFAYQFIGGARVNVNQNWFLFSEYKYFVANYKWESEVAGGAPGPSFSLPFRTHIVAGGVGFRF